VGLVYFTDRDLGQRFPDILEAAGIDVRDIDRISPMIRETSSGMAPLLLVVGLRSLTTRRSAAGRTNGRPCSMLGLESITPVMIVFLGGP
jgi:hypothetical protein